MWQETWDLGNVSLQCIVWPGSKYFTPIASRRVPQWSGVSLLSFSLDLQLVNASSGCSLLYFLDISLTMTPNLDPGRHWVFDKRNNWPGFEDPAGTKFSEVCSHKQVCLFFFLSFNPTKWLYTCSIYIQQAGHSNLLLIYPGQAVIQTTSVKVMTAKEIKKESVRRRMMLQETIIEELGECSLSLTIWG